MTKQEALQILKLLSALESGLKGVSDCIPDYLLEEISRAVHVLEREILK